MEIIVFLSIVIAVGAVLTSIVLVRRVKKQIAEMTDVLVDVKNGNGNRRILSATNELTAPLAYEINEIVVAYESRLSTVRQTEETNRQLMTSLSHDVRTPLTTLIGYLDAAHKGLVTGKDRDDYIETARRKAHDLKEYIDVLFDWFKLNSNEFALEIQSIFDGMIVWYAPQSSKDTQVLCAGQIWIKTGGLNQAADTGQQFLFIPLQGFSPDFVLPGSRIC